MYLQNMQNGDGYHTGRKKKILHESLLSYSLISWVILSTSENVSESY